MAKANPFLSSSNGGEFSPRMDARVDFDKYPSGISHGLNLICLPQGGATFRPGTRFVKEIKDSTGVAALLRFEPVSDRSYQIEAGGNYFRFYRNQGQMQAAVVSAAIVNGTFNSDISGWTNRSSGSGSISWSASDSTMDLLGAPSGFGWAEQAITIGVADIFKVHVIAFDVTAPTAAPRCCVQVGSSSLGYDLFKARNLGVGGHMIAFTPGVSNPVYLQFINEQAVDLRIDNVRILSGVPLELTTPYAAADCEQLVTRSPQTADVLYLFHDLYPTYKLERRGDSSWSLSKVFFQDGPYLGVNPDTDLAATNLIKNGSFDTGFSGGWTQAVTGTGVVNYQANAGAVVLSQWSTSAAGTAAIDQAVATGAPAKVHVLHFQLVGGNTTTVSIGTTAGASDILAIGALGAGWYSFSFTPGVSTFFVDFAQASTTAGGAIAGGVSAVFCYNTAARLLQASGVSGNVTVSALGDFRPFTATDVNRLIRIAHAGREPGWGVITAVANDQSASVFLFRNLASTAPSETWQLGAWSATTGFPHVATFYQQRLFAARTASQPQTLWGSQSQDFENMRPDAFLTGATTVLDTCALNFTIAAQRVSPIAWLLGTRQLLIGTGTGARAAVSKGAVLTPSDFAVLPQTSVACADLAPVQIDTTGIFIQKATRAIYDLNYSFQIDGFTASDVTILSDHIAKAFAKQVVYQAEPFSNVWVRLANGKLACLTYKRGQNVVGWTPVEIAATAGGAAVVESLSVIPGSSDVTSQVYSSLNRDELWMIVRRTIGGVTKRYIEVMEGHFDGPNRGEYLAKADFQTAMRAAQVDAFHVDCGLTYKGAPATVISGLTHLNGETVKVVADGAVQADKVVSGGAITLDRAASTVQVGLSYSWVYRGLKLPYGSPTGPSVGQAKGLAGIVFVLRDSCSFDVGVETGDADAEFKDVPFRVSGMPMSQAVPLFTGEIANPPIDVDGGFDSDPRIVLRGTQPLPWTLLGLGPQIREEEA